MTWLWQTVGGAVLVDRKGEPSSCVEFQGEPAAAAGTFERMVLPDRAAYRTAIAKVLVWCALAEKHAARTGIPPAWVLAFLYAEGGGDPNAERVEPAAPGQTPQIGVGLMALTATPQGFPAKFGITFEEAHDPDLNVGAGAEMMAALAARGSLDLPHLASAYNGGTQLNGQPHVSAKSPWGMVEYCGPAGGPVSCCHIERVVRANNTLTTLLAASLPVAAAAPAPSAASTAGRLLGAAVAAGAAYLGVRHFLRRRKPW